MNVANTKTVRSEYEKESESTFDKLCEHCTTAAEVAYVCFNMRPRIYRLMIENTVIKRKDQNGSAEGEIKITTIFIRFFFVLFEIKLCPAPCTLFVRNRIELLSLFFIYILKKLFDYLLEAKTCAYFFLILIFISRVVRWLVWPLSIQFRPKKNRTGTEKRNFNGWMKGRSITRWASEVTCSSPIIRWAEVPWIQV